MYTLSYYTKLIWHLLKQTFSKSIYKAIRFYRWLFYRRSMFWFRKQNKIEDEEVV